MEGEINTTNNNNKEDFFGGGIGLVIVVAEFCLPPLSLKSFDLYSIHSNIPSFIIYNYIIPYLIKIHLTFVLVSPQGINVITTDLYPMKCQASLQAITFCIELIYNNC
jgi:hypothetical protein